MATTVLYRINGGEVIKISVKEQLFTDRNVTYWAVLTDPSLPDGTDIRNPADPINGELRELGFAKMWDGSNVRNAIQGEIDNFPVAEDTDNKLQDKDSAIDLFQNHPRFRKMMVAFADIIKDEINILRAEHGLSARTLTQLKNAIQNRISEND